MGRKTDTVNKKVVLSRTTLFLVGSVIALVSFIAGTRDHELRAFVGPMFGIEVSAQTLDLGSVQNTYQFLKANYDGKLDIQALIDGANRGMVAAAGDEYTVYLDAKEADEYKKALRGDVGAGIGAEIGTRDGQPILARVLPGNPALEAGLRDGDVVVAINDESARDWTAEKAASRIRGEEGTTVKLTIRRGSETKTFTVTRATINNPSVTGEVVDGVGIMTISRFDDRTGPLARKAAQSFKQAGVKGVVVDLRSDGGGYLDAAVDVADVWLSDKLVVTQKRDGKVEETLRSQHDPVLRGVRTVVLVNSGTASASEILAAALRYHNAATIVGEKTFGKGSVQEVIDLGTGGAVLKVTVARWYAPDGTNVDKQGITPDVKVPLTDKDIDAGKDPQLQAAMRAVR